MRRQAIGFDRVWDLAEKTKLRRRSKEQDGGYHNLLRAAGHYLDEADAHAILLESGPSFGSRFCGVESDQLAVPSSEMKMLVSISWPTRRSAHLAGYTGSPQGQQLTLGPGLERREAPYIRNQQGSERGNRRYHYFPHAYFEHYWKGSGSGAAA